MGDGGSIGAISGSNKSKMVAAAILEKFQMAISPQPVISPQRWMDGWLGFNGILTTQVAAISYHA